MSRNREAAIQAKLQQAISALERGRQMGLPDDELFKTSRHLLASAMAQDSLSSREAKNAEKSAARLAEAETLLASFAPVRQREIVNSWFKSGQMPEWQYTGKKHATDRLNDVGGAVAQTAGKIKDKLVSKATVAVQGEALTPEQEAEFAEWYRKAQSLVNDVADGIVEPEEVQAELKQYNVWFSTSRGAMREENRRHNNPQNKVDRYIELAGNPQKIENRVWQAYEAELNRRDKAARSQSRRAAISQAASGALESAKRTVAGAGQTAQVKTAELRDRLNGLVERSRGPQPQPDMQAAPQERNLSAHEVVADMMLNEYLEGNHSGIQSVDILGKLWDALEKSGYSDAEITRCQTLIQQAENNHHIPMPEEHRDSFMRAFKGVRQQAPQQLPQQDADLPRMFTRQPANRSAQRDLARKGLIMTTVPQRDDTVVMPISSTQPRQPQPAQAEQNLRAAAEVFNHLKAGVNGGATPEEHLNGARKHIADTLRGMGFQQESINRIGPQFEHLVAQGKPAAEALVEAVQTYQPPINPTLQRGEPIAPVNTSGGNSAAQAAKSVASGMAGKVAATAWGMADRVLPADPIRHQRKHAHKLVREKLEAGLADAIRIRLNIQQRAGGADPQAIMADIVEHLNQVEGPHGIPNMKDGEGNALYPDYARPTYNFLSDTSANSALGQLVQQVASADTQNSKKNIKKLVDATLAQVVRQYELSDTPRQFAERFATGNTTYVSMQDDALQAFRGNVQAVENAKVQKAAAEQKAAEDKAAAEQKAAEEKAAAEYAANLAQAFKAADFKAPHATTRQIAAEVIKADFESGNFRMEPQLIPGIGPNGETVMHAEALINGTRIGVLACPQGREGKSMPVNPMTVFELASEYGFAPMADMKVMESVMEMKRDNRALDGIPTSFNVMWDTLKAPEGVALVSRMQQLAQAYNIPVNEVKLEVVEIVPPNLSPEEKQMVFRNLGKLEQLGFPIALDDFEKVLKDPGNLSKAEVGALLGLATEVKLELDEKAVQAYQQKKGGAEELDIFTANVISCIRAGKTVVIERVDVRDKNHRDAVRFGEVDSPAVLMELLPEEVWKSGRVHIQGFCLAQKSRHIDAAAVEKATENLHKHFGMAIEMAKPTKQPEPEPKPEPEQPQAGAQQSAPHAQAGAAPQPDAAAATAEAMRQHAENLKREEAEQAQVAAQMAAKLHASRYNLDITKASSEEIAQHALAVEEQLRGAYISALEREKAQLNATKGQIIFRQGLKREDNDKTVAAMDKVMADKQAEIERLTGSKAEPGEDKSR